MSDPADTADEELRAKYDRLNAQFYTAEPGHYFRTRWLSLLLTAGRPAEVAALLQAGSTYEHFSAQANTQEITDAEMQSYVCMESEVLLHQASETLLRLFLAHWSSSGCPWLDVASERRPGEFKRRVEEEVIGQPMTTLQEAATFVFLGNIQRPTAVPPETWQQGIANLAAFLRTFAARWLEDARLYNSLKHGLSVVPGAAQLAFAEQPDMSDARSLGHGTSVDFLDWEVVPPKRRTWKQTTRWLDVSESLALIEVAHQMIEAMWGFGRARYTASPLPKRLLLPAGITPLSFRSPNRGSARHITVPLGIDQQM
jgi:hypothetical protein